MNIEWEQCQPDWVRQLAGLNDSQLRNLLNQQLTEGYRKAVWAEIKRRRILP